jgi:hypothetical protein
VADTEKLVQFYCLRGESLKTERSQFDAQWEESAQRVLPSYTNTFSQPGVYYNPGAKKTEKQYDARAAFACLRFSAVMESISTPQSSTWHRLRAASKKLKRSKRVNMYFDEVTDALFGYRYRPAANFVGNIQQAYLGMGAFGNGTLFLDTPEDAPGLRYRNIHVGELYFDESHAGVINTAYRYFQLSAQQAVDKFGKDNVHESIRKSLEQPSQGGRKWNFLHVVHPNSDYNPNRIDAAGMKFASVYVDVDNKKLVRRGGFRSWPYPTSRYTQSPGEKYGRGPAQWVLPAIKVLNEEKRIVLTQGHRALNPVLLGYDDGVLDAFSLKPGALNKGGVNKDGKALVQALPSGSIAVGEKMMEYEKAIIDDAFLVTLFQILIDTPQMTATEVLERAREKGMLLAPTAGRQQAEFLGPMIAREIDLLESQALLPEMPEELAESGGMFVVEYDSPMSRMQRSEKAAGFMRALGTAAEYTRNTNDPSPLDWFDVDTAFPEIIDIQGAPAAWVRDLGAVQALREKRNQDAQQQQMIQAAPGMAAVAKALPAVQEAQKNAG